MDTLKGWRTIGIGLLIAVAPAALTYLGGIDWTKLVGANGAMIISGALMIGMRLVTDSPVGKKE